MRQQGYLLIVVLVACCAIIACNDKIFTGKIDCSECMDYQPDSAMLFVNLTFNDSIDEIPLVLFRGDVEKGDTDYVDTARVENGNPYWVTIKLNQCYSVRAEYKLDGKTIYSIDGTTPDSKFVTEMCDYDCYVVVNNELNLKIREEFLK